MSSARARRRLALLLAALLFVVAVPAVAALLFFPVMLLAGPHSDILPGVLQPVVLLAGWAAVVGVPAWCARGLFRRLSRPSPPSAGG
jgi:hypothetical protein